MNVHTEKDGCLLSGHILHLTKTTWFIWAKVRKVNSKEHCITSKLNSNKVSYAKYEIINPAKEFSLTLDNASIYLVCYAGIDTDNVKNIGFSVVVSRSSSSTKGGVLNIKSEIPQATLSLKENVLKCTPTVWLRIFVIKL